MRPPKELAKALLDDLLPQQCALCELPSNGPLCDTCTEDLVRAGSQCERCALPVARPTAACGVCLRRPPPWGRAHIPLLWEGCSRAATLALKHSGSRVLAERLLDLIPLPEALTDAVICPVPTTPWRRLKRGFNPAEVVAYAFARRYSLSICPDLLQRRSGPRQAGLNRRQRRANVRGIFHANRSARSVILVDDVVTTGATAEAACHALRRAGVTEIQLAALARAIAPDR